MAIPCVREICVHSAAPLDGLRATEFAISFRSFLRHPNEWKWRDPPTGWILSSRDHVGLVQGHRVLIRSGYSNSSSPGTLTAQLTCNFIWIFWGFQSKAKRAVEATIINRTNTDSEIEFRSDLQPFTRDIELVSKPQWQPITAGRKSPSIGIKIYIQGRPRPYRVLLLAAYCIGCIISF